MSALQPLWLCRVCFRNDCTMYNIVNTTLEGTYERITEGELQVAGCPTSLCYVCVSQLRRCHKFIETAIEANHTLDQWFQNQADIKLTEHSLFSFITSDLEHVHITSQGIEDFEVKQENDITDEEDNETDKDILQNETDISDVDDDTIISEQTTYEDLDATQSDIIIKIQALNNGDDDASEVDNNDCVLVSDDSTDNIQVLSDDKKDTLVLDGDILIDQVSDGEKQVLDHENVNSKVMLNDKNDNDIKKLNHDLPFRSLRPRKRDKINEDLMSTPKLKKAKLKSPKTKPGKKIFACDKCDYKCNWKYLLKPHLMTHIGKKPFACDKCDFKSYWRHSLKLHLMTHSGEKQFSCVQCDFKTCDKSNLKRHIKRHTGEKPFICEICDYKFMRKDALKIHLMIHLREKPFGCHMCKFKSNQKYTLVRHLKTHREKVTCELNKGCSKRLVSRQTRKTQNYCRAKNDKCA